MSNKVIEEDDEIDPTDVFNNIHTLFRRRQKQEKFAIAPNLLGGGGGFDSDFIAIVDRGIALGYTLPSSQILNAMNAYYIADKTFIQSNNIFYIFANGGAAQNFALLNWAENSNTFNGDYPTAITYNTLGIKGNAIDQYFSTNWNASANGGGKYTQNSASRGLYLEALPLVVTIFDGTMTTGSRNTFRNDNSLSLHKINQGGTNLAGAIDFTGLGEKTIVRYDATNVSGYNRGTKTDTTATSAAPVNEEQVVFRMGAAAFGDSTISKYFCGPGHSQAALDAHRLNYAAYRTAIGL